MAKPTKEQINALNLMKSLRKYRQRLININSEVYTCITAIKQKPATSSSPASPSSTHYDRLKQLHTNGNIPSTATISTPAYEKLQLLTDDIGVRHFTK